MPSCRLTEAESRTNAPDATSGCEMSIAFIDGRQLAELMMDAHIGVAASEEIKILKQDEDYFEALEAT